MTTSSTSITQPSKLSWENFTLHPTKTTNSPLGKVLMVALSVLFGCLTLGIFHLISFCKNRKITRELPAASTPSKFSPTEISLIATKVINELFESLTTKPGTSEPLSFFFSIYHPENAKFTETMTAKITDSLFVKFKDGKKEGNLPLTTVIQAIQWHQLDAKWQGLTEEGWAIFSKNALTGPYGRLQADAGAKQVGITGVHPFVTAYSAHEFTEMNRFLRVGKINVNEINTLKGGVKEFVQEFGSESAELIDRVAKERLFACLCLTGSLKMLPKLPEGTIVSRTISSDKFPHIDKYKKGQIVTEESFLSTTLPGGALYGGDIRYTIHLSKNSKGKSVHPFAASPTEMECLFPPSSSFKVVKDVERDRDNRSMIVLEEVD